LINSYNASNNPKIHSKPKINPKIKKLLKLRSVTSGKIKGKEHLR
jgi:hypothetical protein